MPTDVLTERDIDDYVAAAADVALLFVGTSEDEMLAALFRLREDMEMKLTAAFGAEIAGMIAQAFAATVIRRRREIEPGGATSRVLN